MFVILDDWPTWSVELRPWLEQRFSPAVLAAFDAGAEPDWLTWLDHQQAAMDGHHQDSVALFERFMRGNYQGVRVIHATRLSSIDSVIQHGLRAWSADDLRRQANDLLGDYAPVERLAQAIEACAPDHRGGRVYSFSSVHFALLEPDEHRGGRLPHFCTHGGEFLAAVRRDVEPHALPVQEQTHAFLFACNLPWELLSPGDVSSLARSMLLNVLTHNYLDGNYGMYGELACIAIEGDIPPEHIALLANVEALIGRDDLVPGDIQWQQFR